jgi:hypothetical protein
MRHALMCSAAPKAPAALQRSQCARCTSVCFSSRKCAMLRSTTVQDNSKSQILSMRALQRAPMRIDTHRCARMRFDMLRCAQSRLRAHKLQLRGALVRSNVLESPFDAFRYVVLCSEALRSAAMHCQALECASERLDVLRCASISPKEPRCSSPSVNFEMLQCAGIQPARAP